ncbi:polysaccharide pyruvyl transferase family protein [Arachidicoccus terrestris]|uniref:polysaccharide pyruvyl transferase family protein n=1 Tax=Arachidicoccus terrestris TaxID=2875539 RepID=UPI001CC6A6F7|nr:polysaccharide pyruvyl transferase family protein [Arachidicoccus terrestris]UAY56404.1 polysaccharide pyruvyl transferase family protein [Arachidicoccus terrestris]
MSNNKHIAALKHKISAALSPLIDDDYSLLDTPYHNNIGDSLIYEGELSFLSGLPAKRLFSANRKFASLKRIPKKGIILMHGGGNFGDLWRVYQNFRLKIIRERPQQRIVVFPQTVYYANQENLLRDAEVFNSHPDLTICARDHRSYDLLKKHFYKNNILLVPDMAFYLDLNRFVKIETTGKVLLLKRVDKEVPENQFDLRQNLTSADQLKQVEIADWPGIEYTPREKKKWERRDRANRYLTRLSLLVLPPKGIDLDFGVLHLFESRRQLEKGCQFINQYDAIYSTRLHGAILSILLGKTIYVIDNSYGKNSEFFNCWLKDFEDCYLIG